MEPIVRVNILIVDDKPSNLLALEAMLDDPGLNLVRAGSGADALRQLLKDEFALILMDVQMPDMDGLETAAAIREREKTRHTPIIFLTAYEREPTMFHGYSLGAVDFLTKPVSAEVLRSKVAVFAELYRKNLQVQKQAAELQASHERELEQKLAEGRQRWEMERLRKEAERERRVAEEFARNNAELSRLNDEIREASRRKDEFLAMLAHELRNPLAPIVNAVHILRAGPAGSAEVEEARGIIERQTQHMSRLVDDLLDVSRITRGIIQLRKEPVEVAHALARVGESIRPVIAQARHALEIDLPAEPVWLDADPTRLEQILFNLLNNAAKYTEPGGRIWLSARSVNGEVVFRVRDNGIGMPPELLARVFDLFVQADKTLARSRGGMGIGLTLVRSLVEMHGGTIQAKSEGPGKGSEFTVRLPLRKDEVRRTKDASRTIHPSSFAAHPLKILVVDDNREAARTLATLLRFQRHEVDVVHDGPEALVHVEEDRPDVILLDIGLPGLDGYQVAERLRETMGPDRPTLIAVTGYGQEEDRVRALEAGFDYHLVKPVDPVALQAFLVRISPEMRRATVPVA